MRMLITKHSKLIPPAILLVIFVSYSVLNSSQGPDNGHPVTLVLSSSEAQSLLTGKKQDDRTSPYAEASHVHSNASHGSNGHVDIIIMNNKVYDRKKFQDMKMFNRTLSGRKFKKVSGSEWPVVLNNSGASALLDINFNKYPPKNREFLEERVGEMVARARQVGLACKDARANLELKGTPSHFLWDQKHKPSIVWCPNYKVASTTWMINFLRLSHFNENNPAIPDDKPELQFSHVFGARHDIAFDYYPPPSSAAEKARVLKKSLRMIIVRHPFTRLLSAYRDKMIKMHPGPAKFQFRKTQVKIIAKYRPLNSTNKSPHPTFPEFVQYVIDETANLTSAKSWQRNVKCWVSYWAQCNICTTDYNIIMKLETMSEDEQFLITLSKLKELKKMKTDEWRHLKNESSHAAAPAFYSQITQKQMHELYERYKLDFEAFGYDIKDYLPMAKDAEGRSRTQKEGDESHDEYATQHPEEKVTRKGNKKRKKDKRNKKKNKKKNNN
ncbi:carbohydrate sulfotransferase 11-like [Palaemon carinicauda]|uniref:carbohydrate sulfotransferase 11-like n=1 Tax=Palaemon carinicauda TaxID=392227 RepID=UPI0035B6AB5F